MRRGSQTTISGTEGHCRTDSSPGKIPSYLFNKQVDDDECEELFMKFENPSKEE